MHPESKSNVNIAQVKQIPKLSGKCKGDHCMTKICQTQPYFRSTVHHDGFQQLKGSSVTSNRSKNKQTRQQRAMMVSYLVDMFQCGYQMSYL